MFRGFIKGIFLLSSNLLYYCSGVQSFIYTLGVYLGQGGGQGQGRGRGQGRGLILGLGLSAFTVNLFCTNPFATLRWRWSVGIRQHWLETAGEGVGEHAGVVLTVGHQCCHT